MAKLLQYPRFMQYMGQGLFYALFAVVVGFFSTSPVYTHQPPDETLIKLSFKHAGQLKGECRELTPEELAKLPAYKRKGTKECPRERADVVVELEMDGKQLYHVVLRPSGWARSSNANIYRRIVVKAGLHTLKARLRDSSTDGRSRDLRHFCFHGSRRGAHCEDGFRDSAFPV